MSLNKFTNLQIGKDIGLKIGAYEIECENIIVTNNITLPDNLTVDTLNTTNLNVKTVDMQTLNYRTPDVGSIGEVLKTDGTGNVFWGTSAPVGSGIVYSGTLPIPVGQHVKISSDGTTVFQSAVNETISNLNIGGLNLTNANDISANDIGCQSISTSIGNLNFNTSGNIQINGNKSVLTDKTVFSNNQEFVSKKYVDDNAPAGATGPQGIQGATGAQGIQGATGAIGPTGPSNLNSATLQSTYDNSLPIARCNLTYGTEIIYSNDDGDDILTMVSNLNNSYLHAYRLDTNSLNTSQITADNFIKNGGTNQQYLMADGSSLQYSANSGNSNFYLYNNISGLMTPPPNNGQVGYNNTLQTATTLLYISHRTRDSIDIDVFLAQISQIQDIYLQDQDNSLNFIKYNITAQPTIITNSYISIPVSYTIGNGGGTGITIGGFGNGANILVSFFTNSIEVDTRLSTLETKTQNQTAVTGTTTFSGTGGVVASKFDSQGSSVSFVKGNGSLDTTQYLPLTGGSLTGQVVTNQTPSLATQIVPKSYVDSTVGNYLPLTGGTLTGTLTGTSFVKTGGTSNQYLMANGSSKVYSSNSLDSNYYLYKYGATVTTPAAGYISFNNNTISLSTTIYINYLTSDAISINTLFNQLTTLSGIYIQEVDNPSNFVKYDINSIFLVQNTRITLSVTSSSSGGTFQTALGVIINTDLLLQFQTNETLINTRITSTQTTANNALPKTGGIMTGAIVTSTGSPALQINGSLEGNLYPLTDNLYNVGITTFSYANSEINNMNTKNLSLWNTARTFKTQLTSSNTADATYVMPTTQATTSSLLLNNGTGTLSWSDTANYITLLQTQIQGQYLISFSGITLQTSNGFYPISGFAAIGAANTAVAVATTSTLTKILKLRLNTTAVADGQRSGYIGTATHPVLYGGAGWNYNFTFGIGDTNTTASTSVCQMLCGFTTSLTAPLFSSTLGPNLTPNIFGVGCDVNDSILSFYMRGTTSGQKIATTFSSLTPSNYWLNLNVYNPVNSNNIILTLTDKISGLTASTTFTFSAGSPTASVLNSAQIYPILCRGMGVVGGTTNSAQCLMSRFLLTIL